MLASSSLPSDWTGLISGIRDLKAVRLSFKGELLIFATMNPLSVRRVRARMLRPCSVMSPRWLNPKPNRRKTRQALGNLQQSQAKPREMDV